MIFKSHLLATATTTADEFSERGRSADGGLRNGDLLTLKSAKQPFYRRQATNPKIYHRAVLAPPFGGKRW